MEEQDTIAGQFFFDLLPVDLLRSEEYMEVKVTKGTEAKISEYIPEQIEIKCYPEIINAEKNVKIGLNNNSVDYNKKCSTLKRYSCIQCVKSFNRMDRLLRHHFIHLNIKPYKCNQCVKNFKNSVHLKNHLLTHSEIRFYKCQQCLKEFKRSDSLKRHEIIHTALSLYGCEKCGRRFKRLDHLKNHLATHNNMNSYICNQCGKDFKRLDSLKRHRKTTHKK